MNRGRILFGCVLGLIGSFALARYHPFGDPGLTRPQASKASIAATSELPQEVRSILVKKCGDCHSNHTRTPFYGRFAPVSWLLERDVIKARSAMNLSDWDQYSQDKRGVLLAQINHQAKSGAMPPLQYRMIHWGSRITDSDRAVFGHLIGVPDLAAASSQPATGDPTRGKTLFEKRCTGCHALDQNHEGPRLQGVYERPSGSVPDFAYSTALKKAHIVWDESSLAKWLTDPDALIPGNQMDFLVTKPQERRDIISYLRQSSGK